MCQRTRGEGSLTYATRAGLAVAGVRAAGLASGPAPTTWAHCDACAWTAAWLTARGRELLGPRELLADDAWSCEVRWREHGEARRRRHRPDLAGQLPDGRLMPIEVELRHKSPARLEAILGLHAGRVGEGRTPAVMYVCSDRRLAERVIEEAGRAGLSSERGTLRVELIETIKREAIESRTGTITASPSIGAIA